MSYEVLLRYIRNDMPRVSLADDYQALDFFHEEANRMGIVEFRKHLRNLGVSPVPQIILDYHGKYRPRICTRHEKIDGVFHYILHIDFLMLRNQRGLVYTSEGWITRENFHGYNYEGELVPIESWIRYGAICDECGTAYLEYDEDADDLICPVCERAYQTHSYNAQAQDILGYEDTKEVRYGIELEYEGITARDVYKSIKHHAIAKRDGSIDDGVEVVTKPARMSTHKDALKDFFVKVKTQACSNTGMHVHIERSKISEYQVGFLLEFLNKSNLTKHIIPIAGRDYTDNHYCRNDDTRKMTTGLTWDRKLKRNPTSKYSALNTSKTYTIEVRIFASPESYLEYAARLEFIEGLVKYSSPYSISVKHLKDKFEWDTFKTFMETHRKDFPNFHALYQGVI